MKKKNAKKQQNSSGNNKQKISDKIAYLYAIGIFVIGLLVGLILGININYIGTKV